MQSVVMLWTTSDAPPTYLNGLFGNNKLLVPTWGLVDDSTGVRTFRQVLPGHWVKTLLDGPTREGQYLVSWDRRDDAGREIAPGIYFYRLTTCRETRTGKLVLIK